MTFSVSRRPSSSFPSSSSSSFLLFFTLFLLFTFVHPSEGMIDRDGSIECSPNDGLFPAWSFQYEKGGYYSIEIALEQGDWLKHNTTVQVLLMTESQLDPVRSASMEDVCQSTTFNYVGTLWQVTLGANHPTMGEVTIESMPTSDWVRLLILNCDSDEFHFTYNDVAYNPGFEYLSMSQVPYKLLYRAYMFIWSIFAFLWCLHLFAYRRWNIHLQCLMVLFPLTKVAFCVPTLEYWLEASKTGYYPDTIETIVLAAGVADQVIWFGVLYLMATGWRILKASLSQSERRSLLFILASLTLAYSVYTAYGGFLVFLMVAFYILSLRLIFSAIVENGSMLVRQMQILDRHDIQFSLTPLQPKLHQYRYLQIFIVAWVAIDVIFRLWSAIFLRNQPWISDMMGLTISALMFLCLAYSFGMRPFNPYYLQIMTLMLTHPDLAPPDPAEDDQRDAPPHLHYHAEGEENSRAAPDEEGRNHQDQTQRTAPRQAGGYQQLPDANNHSLNVGVVGAVDSFASDAVWSPGSDFPDLPPPGSSSFALPMGVDSVGRVSASPDPFLILDAPLSSDQPLWLGQRIGSRGQQDGIGTELAMIPKSAHKYLPVHIRRTMRDRQHEGEEEEVRRVNRPSRPSRSRSATRPHRSRAQPEREQYI